MKITAAMVKALRDKTGAGMMDCKKALVECGGDESLAIQELRKRGTDLAAAKSARQATEGLIVSTVSEDRQRGALVEVNCETDFVSRGDTFRNFAIPLGQMLLEVESENADVETLNAMNFGNSMNVDEARREVVVKVGENVAVRRVQVIHAADGGQIAAYDHRGRIGVLVEMNPDIEDLGHALCMQVAAMKPGWVSRENIPESVIEQERKLYSEQALETGKPAHIIDRIVDGKLRKFAAENTLLGQEFIKQGDITVEKLLKQKGAAVVRFCKMELGEDIS